MAVKKKISSQRKRIQVKTSKNSKPITAHVVKTPKGLSGKWVSIGDTMHEVRPDGVLRRGGTGVTVKNVEREKAKVPGAFQTEKGGPVRNSRKKKKVQRRR